MTQPQPEYTEGLLLRDMTNPARYIGEAELQKVFKGEVGLGTQATRAQIIETLLTRHYVLRDKKKKLTATDKGCFLIDNLRRFQRVKAIATPEETARWEIELERIAQGAGDPEGFMASIREFVARSVEELKMGDMQQTNDVQKTNDVQQTAQPEGALGKCPACGGEVIEGKRGYGCANWREKDGGCKFVVWKEISGRAIDLETLAVLLAGEATPPLTFTSRDGREFTTTLKVEYDEQQGKWMTRFGSSIGGSEGESQGLGVLGKCPRCGGDVVEGKKGFGCKNWREEDGGCRFVIWKVIAGKELPVDAVRELLAHGETTGPIYGFMSRKGNEFSAKLKLEGEEYKTSFVF